MVGYIACSSPLLYFKGCVKMLETYTYNIKTNDIIIAYKIGSNYNDIDVYDFNVSGNNLAVPLYGYENNLKQRSNYNEVRDVPKSTKIELIENEVASISISDRFVTNDNSKTAVIVLCSVEFKCGKSINTYIGLNYILSLLLTSKSINGKITGNFKIVKGGKYSGLVVCNKNSEESGINKYITASKYKLGYTYITSSGAECIFLGYLYYCYGYVHNIDSSCLSNGMLHKNPKKHYIFFPKTEFDKLRESKNRDINSDDLLEYMTDQNGILKREFFEDYIIEYGYTLEERNKALQIKGFGIKIQELLNKYREYIIKNNVNFILKNKVTVGYDAINKDGYELSDEELGILSKRTREYSI